MAEPIFKIELKTEEKDIYIAVSEDWDKFSYYAYNKKTNTTVMLDFETLLGAIQQWCYNLWQWLK